MYGYDVFHEELLEKIIGSVRLGKNPHSYIFEGAEGIGKGEAVKLVSASVLCTEKNNAPCGVCKSCVMAKAGTHPDVKYIVPEKDKKTIGVNPIRDLNDDAFIKPFFSDKKVYIIDGELMTIEAQNAFLKTLEEPPSYAVFIITVTDSSKLLQTIISRCALIKFLPLPVRRMERYLSEKYPSMRDSFPFYISYSGGNPGRLDMLLESPELSVLRDECLKIAEKVVSSDVYNSFDVSAFFDSNKTKVSEILDILLMFFRDMLFIAEGFSENVINSDYMEKLKNTAAVALPERILTAAETVAVCGEMLKRNVGAKYIGMYLALSVKEEK